MRAGSQKHAAANTKVVDPVAELQSEVTGGENSETQWSMHRQPLKCPGASHVLFFVLFCFVCLLIVFDRFLDRLIDGPKFNSNTGWADDIKATLR